MEELFVYGTLCYPDVQQRIIGREVAGQEATLTGYAKNTDGIYPFIYEDADSTVDGLVLELTQYELDRTDKYETDRYERVRVTLTNGNEVWTYVGTPPDVSERP